MAILRIQAPALLDGTQETEELRINRKTLAEILEVLLSTYPDLEERIFVDKSRDTIRETLLIFHNDELIREKRARDYDRTINPRDEIKLLTLFSGG
ncbi:MAG: hypothetical protein GTO24_04380 [candidate division Zixibacteria bacterium]|nr:hypothetical protein [candidate division Zixibacteria bacterium]